MTSWNRPWRRLAAAAGLLAASSARADMLLLQQNLPLDQAGVTALAIDRSRIVLARARQDKGPAQTIELTLATEPPITVTLRCIDRAAASQVLDALRLPGTSSLDVTARCRP